MISKAKAREAVYRYIIDNGPCTFYQVYYNLEDKYKRVLDRTGVSSWIRQLHAQGCVRIKEERCTADGKVIVWEAVKIPKFENNIEPAKRIKQVMESLKEHPEGMMTNDLLKEIYPDKPRENARANLHAVLKRMKKLGLVDGQKEHACNEYRWKFIGGGYP